MYKIFENIDRLYKYAYLYSKRIFELKDTVKF